MQNEQNQNSNSITPPPAQPPVYKTDGSSPLNSKWLIAGILILILIIFGITGAFLLGKNINNKPQAVTTVTEKQIPTVTPTTTPDPTANWKTYTNTFFNFTLKYPQDWKMLSQKTTNNFNEAANKNLKYDFTQIGVENGLSLNIELTENPFASSSSIDKTKKIVLSDGTEASFYTTFNEGPMPKRGYWTFLWFPRKGKEYSLYLVSNEKLGSQEQLMRKILSTFKFTDQNSAIDTSTWKNQIISIDGNNAILGSYTTNISLKVPSDWKVSTNKIDNCTNTLITNTTGFSMNLKFICSGWSAKYSAWPENYTISSQQTLGSNGGPRTMYRIRFKNTHGIYEYVDADNKNQIMDALMIGFPPPSESTHDYYFNMANLTATNGNELELTIADKIAASIWLKSLDQKQ